MGLRDTTAAVLFCLISFLYCYAEFGVVATGIECFGVHALIGASEPTSLKAIALLSSKTSNATGVVYFTQNSTASETSVHGIIEGLAPGFHGLHIHTFGDLSNGCTELGTHYNPLNKTHSYQASMERHAGDLGNIQARTDGVAEFYFIDCQIPLRGPNSIMGRAIVVHANADDLGAANNTMSIISGNSGPPIACASEVDFQFLLVEGCWRKKQESNENG